MKPWPTPCIDCTAELHRNAPELDGTEVARRINGRRPTPYPGPRCYTHHRRATVVGSAT